MVSVYISSLHPSIILHTFPNFRHRRLKKIIENDNVVVSDFVSENRARMEM